MKTRQQLLALRAARLQRRLERQQAREARRQARLNRPPRIVVASHNLRSNALKELANELTVQLGYKVWRKYPHAVRSNQRAVLFQPGIDKVRQFSAFSASAVSAPSFATTLDAARRLESKQIVVRHLIDASEGKGINIVNRDELNVQAPLYTAYIPKKKEFRVHVFDSKVIDVQEKRKRRVEGEQKEFQVRNTANGYVFCRDAVNPPVDCADVALAAVRALGRTYGAVDIIWNEKQNKSFVLEVNSRPGMQGTTVKKYVAAIRESFNV
jgi:hypothetical protein